MYFGNRNKDNEFNIGDENTISMDNVKIYLSSLKEEVCTPEEEIKYFERIKAGDENAKREFIEKNLRLVVAIAKRYANKGLPFLDLVQEGNLGLMKAVDKFDPSLGNKFSTYATWWIRQAVGRSIADNARTIRIPVHVTEDLVKYNRFRREHEKIKGYAPTTREIADALGFTEEKVMELEKILLEPVSFSQPIGDSEDATLDEILPDDGETIEEVVTGRIELKRVMDRILPETLTQKEQNVISLRFGLEDGRTRTLEEIGEKIGVTRERVRQIEAKALRKLRMKGNTKAELRPFLDSYTG